MADLIIFKLIQAVIAILFSIFISDFRKKKHMESWIDHRILIGVKLSYPILLITYTYVIFTLNSVYVYDIIALILTSVGTLIVIKAKMDLGRYHTWAGYRLKRTKLVTTGIYSHIRHPLYTGIFVFAFGGILSIFTHMHLAVSVVVAMGGVVMMSFLVVSARKEDADMEKKFGRKYVQYKKKVHPFLPIHDMNSS